MLWKESNTSEPTKSARKKSPSPKRTPSSSAKKSGKKSGKKGSGKKNKVAPQTPLTVDILSPPAMLNLYYIAHSCPEALTYRGFPWSGAKKKKKGKGAKKKKGK